ncbi:hypothetical protein K457DRAFT_641512 [Linnemannia elongata AG-77]|uniref:Uncharacterized protein n=1 Tax=Linnemannia elongata AG-77 TaxID=1314771 RepID=A0A197JSC5_9FUNG|nr:hypothetical protein K457DRAFT_641512 [Linnemannia elongata AG-77]
MDAAIAETNPETHRDSQYRTGSCILPTEPYGLDQLSVSKISLPFGSWGGKVGELWQQCFITFLHELEPLIMDATLSGLVMDQYHRQFRQEMQPPVHPPGMDKPNRLSPNLNTASVSTFPSLGAAAAYNRAVNNLQKLEGAIAGGGSLTAAVAAAIKSDDVNEFDREPVDRQSDTSHVMATTLIQKMSTPSLRQQFLASRSASDPGNPSPKAYSTSDTGQREREKDAEEVGEVRMMAPTARKMNRSRNSIRHSSISAGSGSGSASGPTTSASPNAGGGLHSPRIGYGGLRRQESIKSNGGLHSPQAQSANVAVADVIEGDGDPEDQQQATC